VLCCAVHHVVCCSLCDGLQVIHSDLKVRNVLLKSDGSSERGCIAKGGCERELTGLGKVGGRPEEGRRWVGGQKRGWVLRAKQRVTKQHQQTALQPVF